MFTILFWNTHKNKRIAPILKCLAEEHRVDMLVLVENVVSSAELIHEINEYGVDFRDFSFTNDRITILSNLPENSILPQQDSHYAAIKRIDLPAGLNFILVALHLPSKLHTEEYDQAGACRNLIDQVIQLEDNMGHSRTIVVGDFNMDPFEKGIVASDCFHGVMCRRIAGEVNRIVQGEPRNYFYNPMWRKYGDSIENPVGSYFYRSSGRISYFWHIFDQVLFRPALLEYFNDDDIIILSKYGENSLLNKKGIPDHKNVSDHLPLLVKLHLNEGETP